MNSLGNLMKKKQLKVLKISDCNIDPEVSDLLLDIFKQSNFSSIEWLAYNYNEVSDPCEFLRNIRDSL